MTDILELSQQLAGEDTVRITRQPVQVTLGRPERGHNTTHGQVEDVIGGQAGPEVTAYGGICGRRHAGAGTRGRVKNSGNTEGDTEFGEWRGGVRISRVSHVIMQENTPGTRPSSRGRSWTTCTCVGAAWSGGTPSSQPPTVWTNTRRPSSGQSSSLLILNLFHA